MKPKTTQYYETTSGQPVKTLDEWKRAEVAALVPAELVDEVLIHAADLIEILSATERGRPRGAKNKTTRKKPATPTVVPPAA